MIPDLGHAARGRPRVRDFESVSCVMARACARYPAKGLALRGRIVPRNLGAGRIRGLSANGVMVCMT